MTWRPGDLRRIEDAEEVHVRTRRRDGSLRSPRVIWVVTGQDEVFIRSTNGRGADWFRWATATGTGQLVVGGHAHEVRFVEVAGDAELDAADAGFRRKYGRYASIVQHLLGPDRREATLQVLSVDADGTESHR